MNETKILLAQSSPFHKDNKILYFVFIFSFLSYAHIYIIWKLEYPCPYQHNLSFFNKIFCFFFCCRKLGALKYMLTRLYTASYVVSQNSVQTQNFSFTSSIEISSFLQWWICLMCFPPKLTSKM